MNISTFETTTSVQFMNTKKDDDALCQFATLQQTHTHRSLAVKCSLSHQQSYKHSSSRRESKAVNSKSHPM
jgi:hypothetical protein